MSQIFVSHSGRDTAHLALFERAFANTHVRAVFEEFDAQFVGKVTAAKVARDIGNSNAVFVLLSQTAQGIPHTRDWITWEAGVSEGRNRDLWVFEPVATLGTVNLIIPALRHYVLFPENGSFVKFLHSVIVSYDDHHVVPTTAVTAGLGAAMGRGPGALLGLLAGLMLSGTSTKRPAGMQARCNGCGSIFSVHVPRNQPQIRCPACNASLAWNAGVPSMNVAQPAARG